MPAQKCHVDLKNRTAVIGPLHLTFTARPDGGFSPGYYKVNDCHDDELIKIALRDIQAAIDAAGPSWIAL